MCMLLTSPYIHMPKVTKRTVHYNYSELLDHWRNYTCQSSYVLCAALPKRTQRSIGIDLHENVAQSAYVADQMHTCAQQETTIRGCGASRWRHCVFRQNDKYDDTCDEGSLPFNQSATSLLVVS